MSTITLIIYSSTITLLIGPTYSNTLEYDYSESTTTSTANDYSIFDCL